MAKKVVAKFGGSSVCDAMHFQQVGRIVRADSGRGIIVVSAPGVRFPGDKKVTNLLFSCHDQASHGLEFESAFVDIAERFREIVRGLDLDFPVEQELEEIRQGICRSAALGFGPDFAASRGEYLCAKIMARYLGFEFVDAQKVIYINGDGQVTPKTYRALAGLCDDGGGYVFSGFYGQLDFWNADSRDPRWIKIFPRGGSDISGAVIAAGVGASLYENWTDGPLRRADPRIIPAAAPIPVLTYGELRELAYRGANV